jgi:ribonuclease HIII
MVKDIDKIWKEVKPMSNYEYNKKYAEEWNKKNMKNVGVSLRIEQYEKLKKYCDSNNIAVSAFIKSRISDIIE